MRTVLLGAIAASAMVLTWMSDASAISINASAAVEQAADAVSPLTKAAAKTKRMGEILASNKLYKKRR